MMNSGSALLRKGLAPGGGVLAVTLAGWCGEHSASRSAHRVATQTVEKVAGQSHLLSASRRCFSSATTQTSGTTAKTAKPAATKSPTFVQWYEGHLEKNPILTKSVTGSILWGVGDAVAQVVPQVSSAEASPKGFTYDWMRTGRAVTFGGIIHAPTSHVHFNFLEWMTVRSGLQGLQIPVFKTIMEQFVYWSWISNSMYHAAMGFMQGMGPSQIYDRIADVLMDTQKAQWAFWIPVQLLNFNFVPVRHQLNVVLVTSIVWTALLSMWYPPIVEEHPEDVKPE